MKTFQSVLLNFVPEISKLNEAVFPISYPFFIPRAGAGYPGQDYLSSHECSNTIPA